MAAETPNVYPVTRPDYRAVRECAQRFPGVDIAALETVIELQRIGSQLFADYDAFFARHKTSRGRFLVLVTLMQHPEGRSPGELAEYLQVTRATMTGLIDTLEQNHDVERHDEATDRRMSRIVITDKGRAFLDQLLPLHYQRAGLLMSPFSADERAEFQRLLLKLESGIQKLQTTASGDAG